jgi:hypothetical protein
LQSDAGRPSALPCGFPADIEAAGVMRFDAPVMRFRVIAGRMNLEQ